MAHPGDPVDWWTGLSVGVLAMSIVIFAGDFVMQYWLAIRWGPTKTTDLVVERFQDKPTAAKVREALELPDRATVKGLVDKIKEMELQLETKMIALEAKLDAIEMPDLAPLEAKLEELGNKSIEFPEETVQAIASDISSQVQAAVSGHVGAAVKGEKAEAKKMALEVQEEYYNSPEWERDQAGNIELVAKYMPNGSRGAAKFIVKRGPAFVDAWAHHTLGRDYGVFKGLWDALQQDGPAAGTIQVQGGGWLTR